MALTTLNLPGRGGVLNHILTLSRRIDRTRFRLVILYWSALEDLDLEREIADPDIEVHRLPALWSKRLLFLPAFVTLARWYVKLDVEVVYSIFAYTDIVAAPAARLAGVPAVVSSIRGRLVAENNPFWERAFFRAAHPIAARFIDTFVAVSAATAAEAVAHLSIDRAKCIVVTNGIRCSDTEPSPYPAVPTIGVLSRLQYEKGIDVLIRSVPRILSDVPDLRVVVAGDGPDRVSLERLAASLGVARAVEFRGWCDDASRIIAEWALLVIPSHREGVPWALLEAMCQGRCVVASAVGGIPEVLLDGVTGRLVPAGDPVTLARVISELLVDAAKLAQLGAAGRRRVVESFSEEATMARLESVLAAAAGGRQRG